MFSFSVTKSMAYKQSQNETGEAAFIKRKTFLHLFCPFTQGLPGSEIPTLLMKGLGGHQQLYFTVVRTDTGKKPQEHSNESCEY